MAEQDRLAALARHRILNQPPDPHLEAMARLAASICDTSDAAVNLINADLQLQIATASGRRSTISREDPFTEVALQERTPLVVPDTTRDSRFASSPLVTGVRANLRSYAAAQLRTDDGQVVGTLCVFDDEFRPFSRRQIEDLEILADQVMQLLEARRRERQLAEIEQRFRLSYDNAPIGMAMVTLDFAVMDCNSAFAELVGQQRSELIGVSVMDLVHPDDREKKLAYARMVLEGLQSTYRLEQRYLRHGEDVWVELWCSLVRDPDGQPLYFIKQAQDITHRRELTAELVHKATHDPLTGLPNRGLLDDRLSQALARIRRGGEVVTIAIDLDGFKRVNDTYGHAAGDEVLVEIAHRLHESVRASDTVCRLGGDEFIVVCEDVSGEGVARDLAQRIVNVAHKPVRLRQGGDVAVGASIGVAVTSRADDTPESLLHTADEALYRAKRKGRGRIELTEISLPADDSLQA